MLKEKSQESAKVLDVTDKIGRTLIGEGGFIEVNEVDEAIELCEEFFNDGSFAHCKAVIIIIEEVKRLRKEAEKQYDTRVPGFEGSR